MSVAKVILSNQINISMREIETFKLYVTKLMLMVFHISYKGYPIKLDKYLHFKLECFDDEYRGAIHAFSPQIYSYSMA